MVGAIRIALIVAFALGIVVATGDALTPGSGASFISTGLFLTGVPDRVRVESLGPVTVTGDVRPGDTLLLGEPKVLLRLYALVYPAHATFTNLRTGATVGLADPPERPAAFRAREFVRQLLMLTALVLLVLRGRQPAVLALATYIYLIEYTLPTFSGYWLGTWGAIAYVVMQGPLEAIAPAMLVLPGLDVRAENTRRQDAPFRRVCWDRALRVFRNCEYRRDGSLRRAVGFGRPHTRCRANRGHLRRARGVRDRGARRRVG